MGDTVNPNDLPEVVRFRSGKLEGRAFVVFGEMYGITYGGMFLNFKERPEVKIEYVPNASRVSINDGRIWFDTSEESAAAIEYLFENDHAPPSHTPER